MTAARRSAARRSAQYIALGAFQGAAAAWSGKADSLEKYLQSLD